MDFLNLLTVILEAMAASDSRFLESGGDDDRGQDFCYVFNLSNPETGVDLRRRWSDFELNLFDLAALFFSSAI